MSQPIVFKVNSIVQCIQKIKDAIPNHNEVILIKTPGIIPEILETLSESAYMNKKILFFYITHFDSTYNAVVQKIRMLGNLEVSPDLTEKMQKKIAKKSTISIELV
jgi:hypothetical protein